MISRRKFVIAAAQSLALASTGHALQGAVRQRVRGFQEAVTWTPASLASIVDWWTPADYTIDGEGLIQITGREGDIIMAQTTPSQKAVIASGASPSGQDAADPDGGDEISTAITGGQFTSSPLAQPFGMAGLIYYDAWGGPSNANIVFSGANAGTRFFDVNGTQKWRLNFGTQITSVGTASTGVWYRFIVGVSGASSYVDINEVNVLSGDAGANNLNGLKLWEDFSGANHADAKYVSGLLMSSLPSAAEKSDIWAWLGLQ